jgi:hypothetical protein
MRCFSFLGLEIAAVVLFALVVPAHAATISAGDQDLATLGNWRTAAPDADAKYGTDGYVMLYYAQAKQVGYRHDPYPTYSSATQDLAVLPSYISGYQVANYGGADGGTLGAGLSVCPEDPVTLQKLATNHIYGHPNDPNNPDVIVNFTVSQGQAFKLALYAGHESNPSPAWVQDYEVSGSLGGVGRALNVPAPAGEWWVFDVNAAAGETITVKALHQPGNSPETGDILSIVAFDAVPEPGSVVLLATGLLGLAAYAWRRRK